MKDDERDRLLHITLDWEKEWKAAGMPEYSQENINPWQSLVVHFKNQHDREDFFAKLGFPPRTNTNLTMKWTWYPPQDYQKWTDKSHPPTKVGPNKYPVYVISKGRADTMLTIRQLRHLGIPHFLVVEPQERERYAMALLAHAKVVGLENSKTTTLLVLPEANYGKGCSIPARNWVWAHSMKLRIPVTKPCERCGGSGFSGRGTGYDDVCNQCGGMKEELVRWKVGADKHWILDDNIQGFFEFNRNEKPKIRDYNPFEIVERFVDRHNNVGLAGMNYEFFVQRRNDTPPYYLNTRVYSCILIRNDLPFRWRGTYNEDTDLSLRVLKSGMSTVLFNYVLAKKVTTMIMKGGNEAIYKLKGEDGRLKMAQALMKQHPDLVKITHKWGRWQHQVNYAPFSQNRLDR
jgi:hypothetical protein